jgi:hypothetical protein
MDGQRLEILISYLEVCDEGEVVGEGQDEDVGWYGVLENEAMRYGTCW